MAGEDARLTFGIDASGAQAGARQFVDATAAVEKGATSAAKGVDTLEKRTVSIGKQFGLAKGPLKEFGQIGASVFAGDILAKALGFTSVMGAVNSATQLLADGIVALATGFKKDLVPSITEAIDVQERFYERQKALAKQVQDLRRGGPGAQLGPFDDQSRFYSTAGLSDDKSEKLLTKIRDLNEQYRKISAGEGGPGTKRTGFFMADAELALKEAKPALDALFAQLKEAQRLDDQRKESAKARLEVETKIGDELERQRNAIVRGQGGPSLGVASYGSSSAEAARQSGLANAQGQFAEFQNMRKALEAVPGKIVPAIMSAFGSSASIIASALFSGSPEVAYRDEAVNFEKADKRKRNIEEATEEARRYRLEQERIIKEAREFENFQIGSTIASGFEEAILSGQQLSDVLRQLYSDLVRLVFRQNVTGPLSEWFTGKLNGPTGGGTYTPPFANGSGPIVPEGAGGSNYGAMAAGGVGGGFRLSGRQMRENVARSF